MLVPTYVKVLVALSLVAVATFFIYDHGREVANAKWSAKWSDRDAADEKVRASIEKRERQREQSWRERSDKISAEAQAHIDAVQIELASANTESSRLQQLASNLVRQIGSGKNSLDSCTTDASSAAENSARVLANLLTMADSAAGRMAEIADQARTRGLACEATYRSLTLEGN